MVCDKVACDVCERWCAKDGVWQNCVWKVVCDKIVCERLCVTKWCVKDVCQRWWVTKLCVSKRMCERWCEKWSCDGLWCENWGVRSGAVVSECVRSEVWEVVMNCDVISEVWEAELWWIVWRRGAARTRAAARLGGSVYCMPNERQPWPSGVYAHRL